MDNNKKKFEELVVEVKEVKQGVSKKSGKPYAKINARGNLPGLGWSYVDLIVTNNLDKVLGSARPGVEILLEGVELRSEPGKNEGKVFHTLFTQSITFEGGSKVVVSNQSASGSKDKFKLGYKTEKAANVKEDSPF